MPISLDDVLRARARLQPFLRPTPLRRYAALDDEVGHAIEVWVKHENHLPTGSFKARNGLAALSALAPAERRAGVVAASRGTHGAGLAWAGMMLDTPVTICVPRASDPEKTRAMRGFFANVLEQDGDYEAAAAKAERLARERGLALVHATHCRAVIAGAATLTLEMLEQQPELDAIIFVVDGGTMAAGGMTVVRALHPGCRLYAVAAAGATTFSDGAAACRPQALTSPALREGFAGVASVSDVEIAAALRMLVRTTHNLADGAAAAGLAGLLKLANRLAGKTVGIVLSGSYINEGTLARVMSGELEHAS